MSQAAVLSRTGIGKMRRFWTRILFDHLSPMNRFITNYQKHIFRRHSCDYFVDIYRISSVNALYLIYQREPINFALSVGFYIFFFSVQKLKVLAPSMGHLVYSGCTVNAWILSLCHFKLISLTYWWSYILTAAKLRNLTMYRYPIIFN